MTNFLAQHEHEAKKKDELAKKSEEIIEKLNKLMLTKLDAEHYETNKLKQEEDLNDKLAKLRQ